MQIEALRICNLPISRCPVFALAFQGESWNNQAASIRRWEKEEGKKKKRKRLQMWRRASQWLVFTLAAVAVALPQITTCPLCRGPVGRCYSGTTSSARGYFGAGELFCAILPTEISVVPSWVSASECSDCLHREFTIFNEFDWLWLKRCSALMYIHLRWSLEFKSRPETFTLQLNLEGQLWWGQAPLLAHFSYCRLNL